MRSFHAIFLRHKGATPIEDRRLIGLAQGRGNVWLCGSYASLPCHEDAFVSGLAVAAELGAPYPFASAPLARERYLYVRAGMHLPAPELEPLGRQSPLPLAPVRRAKSSSLRAHRSASGPLSSSDGQVDVVVVGAGPSGLAAACRLHGRARTIVLEASERAGGRAWTRRLSELGVAQDNCVDAAVDLGATFASPKLHDRLLDFLRVGGLRLIEAPRGERVLMAKDIWRYSGAIPPTDKGRVPEGALDALLVLEDLCGQIDVVAPEKSGDDVLALDRVTVAEWASERFADSPLVRDLVALLVFAIIGSDPGSTSFFYFLWYLATSGGPSALMSEAQSMRVLGGIGATMDRIAQEIDCVRYASPVTQIVVDGEQVRVDIDGGHSVKARAVVVALPPLLAQAIKLDPPPPAQLTTLLQRVSHTPGIRVVVTYPEATWRKERLSGEIVSVEDPEMSPLGATFDVSPPASRPGILIGFAVPGLSPEVRRARVLEQLRRAFGVDPTSAKYHEVDWGAQAWARGAAAVVPEKDTLAQAWFTLQSDSDRVFWAGAWVSPQSFCYLDGAVRAGEAAAERALALLERGRP
jgi:monoamine oxidase